MSPGYDDLVLVFLWLIVESDVNALDQEEALFPDLVAELAGQLG
jgi:hypothetical protein